MFKLSKEDLAYEKYMRFLAEADEIAQQQSEEDEGFHPNPQDPAEMSYQQGLDEIQKIIRSTARKRYQKYKMDGGRDTFEMFKKNMETQLKDELEQDMKEQFGAVPGKETEKDFLRQIKKGIDQLNSNIAIMAGQPDPNAMPMEQGMPEGQPQEAPPEQMPPQQEQIPPEQQGMPEGQPQEAPPEQQPMQETIDFLNDYYYEKAMNDLFDRYFR